MIVDDLRREIEGDRVVVSARITFEDCDRKPARMRFDFDTRLADDVECNPNAFLVATAAPARYCGEKRVLIEGTICPVLRDNVLTALTQLREWYDKSGAIPAIESTGGLGARSPRSPRRAGQFFSGGIDALATLRRNRLLLPADHDSSIRDCINVFGMHTDDYLPEDASPNPQRVEMWDRNLVQLRKFAKAADVDIYQIRTNAVGIFNKSGFHCREYHSAVMTSLAHVLTSRLSDVFIASSDYVGDVAPWGSHPLLDPYYSSSDLQVFHDGVRLTRLEKVRLISEWPAALSAINVCSSWTVPESGMNCGECGKCLRTMVELLVCGKLHEAATFPARDIDPALFKSVVFRTVQEVDYFMECIEPLRAMGRDDLIRAIDERMLEYRRWRRSKSGSGFKQQLKKIDEFVLGGQIRQRWLAFRGNNPAQGNRRKPRASGNPQR
ncbi:MAG: hypothetical protein AB7O26_16645 [Planctomycetaceae bacterium]